VGENLTREFWGGGWEHCIIWSSISPQRGVVDPQNFFLRTKVGHALKRDVIGFRQMARQVRRTTPPKTSNPRSSENHPMTYPENFTEWTYPNSLSIKEVTRKSCFYKFLRVPGSKISVLGVWPPNRDPQPHMAGAACRDRRGVHNVENIASISHTVPEICGFKLFPLAPPTGQTGSGRGQVTSSVDSTRRGLRVIWVWRRWDPNWRR